MISLCRHSKLSSQQTPPSRPPSSTLADCWSFVSLEKANFYAGKHFNQTHSLFFLYPVWSPLLHSLWDQFTPTCTLFLLLLRSLACMVALPSLPNGDFLWNSFTCVFSALPFFWIVDYGIQWTSPRFHLKMCTCKTLRYIPYSFASADHFSTVFKTNYHPIKFSIFSYSLPIPLELHCFPRN